MIFQNICNDVFPAIDAPRLTNKFRVKEIIEAQLDKNQMSVNDDVI